MEVESLTRYSVRDPVTRLVKIAPHGTSATTLSAVAHLREALRAVNKPFARIVLLLFNGLR